MRTREEIIAKYRKTGVISLDSFSLSTPFFPTQFCSFFNWLFLFAWYLIPGCLFSGCTCKRQACGAAGKTRGRLTLGNCPRAHDMDKLPYTLFIPRKDCVGVQALV